ncbi:MAG: aldehyde ferredoxin oxidoreductase family protein [Candidatus Lokiarchaeota archaeon]|nr:aldehyde ferredoxin oxidoreductase family protein [Candidatus Lokiarchaeota archaeon]
MDWIGGKGLGTKLLLDEVPPRCDPLGPENKIIIVRGPLTGTNFPTCNRYGMLFKSPQTGTYAESYSGGDVGRRISATGNAAIIIEGVSEMPMYLHVSPDGATFHDASSLWGKDTSIVRDGLKGIYGANSESICIGVAGEHLVRIASVQNNKHHSAGRCGPGAVMGSKKLKAIVFSGTARPAINDNPAFKELVKEALTRFKKNPLLYGPEGVYRKLGTPSIVEWANVLGCFPTRYYASGFSDGRDGLGAETISASILKRREGCWNCPFTCGKHVEVSDGPFACQVKGPEYETIANFGGLCDIRDIKAVARINDYCNRVGIDTISAGALCGLAIEARRRGMIPALNGSDLDYGNAGSVLAFLEDMVHLRGVAADFAMGTRHVAQKHGLQGIAMHVKGLEFAGYDPRAFRGFALSYGVAPEGATHLRSVYHSIERELPPSYENRVVPMIEQEDKMAIIDSLIVCKFIRVILDWDFLAKIYNVVLDSSIDGTELRAIAARMITGSRIFNVKAGFSRKDDYLPERTYTEALPRMNGPPHELDKASYDRMLDEYYAARGWNRDGTPPGTP